MTQEIANVLRPKGYSLTCRGTISVKGKGDMVTYFLEGQDASAQIQNKSPLGLHMEGDT